MDLLIVYKKVIQATFSQGRPNFGRTRGIQYTCISLFSIYYLKQCHDGIDMISSMR